MTYFDTWTMINDDDLIGRITACVALEGDPLPDLWTRANAWAVMARTDWADAYSYAVNVPIDRPGKDVGVITDQMILSSVQAVRTP